MSIPFKWFQHDQVWGGADLVNIILRFDLFFQLQYGLSSQFGVKQGQSLNFGVKHPKDQRF